jgi:hypothetical protein
MTVNRVEATTFEILRQEKKKKKKKGSENFILTGMAQGCGKRWKRTNESLIVMYHATHIV